MTLYIVTVQGRFIDVFTVKKEAEACKHSLYMAGNDGILIQPKVL